MTKLKIKVTKDEIMEGSCSNIYSCAVALAVRDIFPEAVVAGTYMMPFGLGGTFVSIPKEATAFIATFDGANSEEQREKLLEIEFEVDLPDNVIEQINIDELKPLLQNHPNLQLT